MEAKELQLEKKLGEARKRLKVAKKKYADFTSNDLKKVLSSDVNDDIIKKENAVNSIIVERDALDAKMSKLELEKKQTFKLMQQDNENNEREQDRQSGTPLVYGDTIQFRHKYSNKFLAGSTTKTALLEYNSLRVSLEEESDRSCFFKVMSKFKVRVEGDEVKEGDQVLLVSDKAAGRFL